MLILGKARVLAGPEDRAGPEDGSSFRRLCRRVEEGNNVGDDGDDEDDEVDEVCQRLDGLRRRAGAPVPGTGAHCLQRFFSLTTEF